MDYIALVEVRPGIMRAMPGSVHDLRGERYIVVEDGVTTWYPVVSDIYEHVDYDVYGNPLFLRDIVGFFDPDGNRRVGVLFEDDEWGAVIVGIDEISYGPDASFRTGRTEYLCDGVRRLCSSLEPKPHEIQQFLSGSSIESEKMKPAQLRPDAEA